MHDDSLVLKLHKQESSWLERHLNKPDRFEMSDETLKALAEECGLQVEDPDALYGSDGKPLRDTPPMIFGRRIYTNDQIPFGSFHLIETYPEISYAR